MHTVLRRYLLFSALVIALFAVAILAALIFQTANSKTTFADASSGVYAVVSKTGVTADTIAVVRAGDLTYEEVLITIPHLAGMSVRGTTSPDGTKIAFLVVDEGDSKNPVGSLRILDLETESYTRLTTGVDLLQKPLWSPDSKAVLVTVSQSSKNSNFVDTAVISYPIEISPEGRAKVIAIFHEVVLAVPLEIDQMGDLVTVVINERGSLLFSNNQEVLRLSPYFTRDWALSPSGKKIAFIESNLESGLRYLPRIESISGGSVKAAAVLPSSSQALGVVWKFPKDEKVDFGNEPTVEAGQVRASTVGSGFDIPLAWEETEEVLFVEHWTGLNFENPGKVELQIVISAGRQSIAGYTRFLGWISK